MAGNIKGITIEFNGDTSQLDKSIREVDKNTRNLDKELKDVNKGLKFNPTSVDLWRQKQTLLTQKINETQQKLTLLKQKQAALDAKDVDKNSEEYRRLQREIIETESKLKTFKGQLQAVGNVKLRAASEQLKQIGSKATAAGHAMAGVSRAAGVVAAGIGALAVKSGQWADDLNTLSKQYRLSTKQLQLYSAAADLVDVDVNAIAKSHLKLVRNMKSAADGSKSQAEAFKQLGIDVTNSDGSLRDSEEVWQQTIKALGQMSNETERDALAMTIMGKSAAELNPLIADQGETYQKLVDTMKKYDLDFIDQETLDRANEFNDQIDTMKAIGKIAFQSLGAQLADVLAPALQVIVDYGGRFMNWLSKLNPVVIAVVGGVASLVAVVSPALLLFGALASAAGALTGALATISAPMIAIGAAIAGLIAVFAAAYTSSEPFRKAINEIASVIGAQLMSVLKSAVSFFKQLFSIIVSTATSVATDLAPVLQMLMPVIAAIATFLAGRLKKAFTLIINVVKLLSTVIKTVASIFKTAFLAIGNFAINAYNRIKGAFSKVKNALVQPFETAKNIIKGIIDKIKGFFNFKVSTPHIPLPHFAIKPAGWKIGDLVKGKIPSLSVDWYARGGIFDSPTIAGIGEAGPEAVVPLDKFWDKLDKIQGGDTFNIVINDADSMSVKQIADRVTAEIIKNQNRRRLAWR